MAKDRPGGFMSSAEGSSSAAKVKEVWKWGSDNLFPVALSTLSRSSTIHRRILNDKSDYVAGRGFSVDATVTKLVQMLALANGRGQTLRSVLQRVAFDKCLFGNAFIEIVTDEKRSFLSLYHQDASRCRIAKDNSRVVLHHNWASFSLKDAVSIPIFPNFESRADGTMRSIIHYKDYEPMFENYGVPKYVAAIGAASIAYKTDKWNVSRLDNAFQLSGVMVLDGEVDSETEARDIASMAERKFAGKPGQVMFMVKNGIESDTTKFVPINTSSDGDWRGLHEQATSDIVVAHSWFRTLSGLNYSTGFSADRILYEYNIALQTIITVEQQEILEPIKEAARMILEVDCSSLAFVNRPPFEVKPPYMKVWEARKADGYEYDERREDQNVFLAQI